MFPRLMALPLLCVFPLLPRGWHFSLCCTGNFRGSLRGQNRSPLFVEYTLADLAIDQEAKKEPHKMGPKGAFLLSKKRPSGSFLGA